MHLKCKSSSLFLFLFTRLQSGHLKQESVALHNSCAQGYGTE